jgi:hypothetical protein
MALLIRIIKKSRYNKKSATESNNQVNLIIRL